jgi:hypothetical protein
LGAALLKDVQALLHLICREFPMDYGKRREDEDQIYYKVYDSG